MNPSLSCPTPYKTMSTTGNFQTLEGAWHLPGFYLFFFIQNVLVLFKVFLDSFHAYVL